MSDDETPTAPATGEAALSRYKRKRSALIGTILALVIVGVALIIGLGSSNSDPTGWWMDTSISNEVVIIHMIHGNGTVTFCESDEGQSGSGSVKNMTIEKSGLGINTFKTSLAFKPYQGVKLGVGLKVVTATGADEKFYPVSPSVANHNYDDVCG